MPKPRAPSRAEATFDPSFGQQPSCGQRPSVGQPLTAAMPPPRLAARLSALPHLALLLLPRGGSGYAISATFQLLPCDATNGRQLFNLTNPDGWVEFRTGCEHCDLVRSTTDPPQIDFASASSSGFVFNGNKGLARTCDFWVVVLRDCLR